MDRYTPYHRLSPHSNHQVGPLFACIIGKQFKKLRDGDRFFFTHHRDASTLARGLKSRAREIVLGRSLGRILCDNLEDSILAKKVVGKEVMKTMSSENPRLDCNSSEPGQLGRSELEEILVEELQD